MTKPTKAQSLIVQERAHYRCEYCQSRSDFSTTPFHIDHILPQSLGGPTHLENLAFTCGGCNLYKATKTHAVDPQKQKVVSLFNPRQHVWNEHFCWDENATHIHGLTSIGRATIDTLRMNRTDLVNLRLVLHHAHAHPPKYTRFCQQG